MDRIKIIKRASIISILGNMILSIIKIGAGLIANSYSIIADGIDSAGDVISSIITYFASSIMEKPADKNHPYGHARVEAIASIILSFLIFYIGVQLIITSITKLINGDHSNINSALGIIAIIISIFIKLSLSIFLCFQGKKISSSMLKANGKNMRNDVFLSGSVLLSLVITEIFNFPQIDSIFTILIGLWIIKVSVEIFIEVNNELMDGLNDMSIYEDVIQCANKVEEASNPHRIRIRKHANLFVIDIDIEVNGKMCVYKSHEVAKKVEKSLKSNINNIYDVVVHIEPKGNIEDEKYGINEDELNN